MPTTITINKNGPLKIEGEIILKDAAGQVFDLAGKSTVFLCRCGQTKKAPFCDGTHKSCGFVSEVTAPAPEA